MPGKVAVCLGVMALALAMFLGPAMSQQQQPSQPPPATPPAQTSPAQPPPKEDPLVEAARKAKEKKAKSEPRKVYTDDDLEKNKGTGVFVLGQEASDGASKEEKKSELESAPGKAASAAKGEAYWRGRARKIREQMEAVDKQIDKVREEIKTGGSSGFSTKTSPNESVIYIHDRNAQLKQLEQRRAGLQKQMDDLMEEGRRAGADPGWFR